MHRKRRSLDKTQPMWAFGNKAAAIHHARGNPSPRPLDLRQPLSDLPQPPALKGQVGDRATLYLSQAGHYVHRSQVSGGKLDFGSHFVIELTLTKKLLNAY